MTLPTTPTPEGYHHHEWWPRLVSFVAKILCSAAAAVALVMLFLILGYMVWKGISGLHWSFFTHLPLQEPMGMRNCIVGTLLLAGIASLIGVPIGMLCGIYLAEYAPRGWSTQGIRLTLDVLAGTPTILFGVVVYQIMVVRPQNFNGWVGHLSLWSHRVQSWMGITNGYSGWAGGLALALIMVPIIARTTEEMLRMVPLAHREASAGLGASKAETLWRVVIPSAKAGIITGIMLAIARVAGETAPLFFTAFGNDAMVYNPNRQTPSLTEQIYNYSQSDDPHWRAQAWTASLVLVSMVLVFSAAVRIATRKRRIRTR
jgi:phosphate transport system permease protein